MGRKSSNRVRKDNPAKRREWIIELYPHFRDNGLKDLKMDRVAILLGKSKSTVYEYFISKEEIVAETISYKLEALLGFEEILMDKDLGLRERYLQLMAYMIPILTDISNLLLFDVQSLYPSLWLQVDAFYDHASYVLEQYYREGIEKGVFRNIHPAILAHSDRFFFKELVDPKFLAEKGISANEAFEGYFDLKFRGLMK
ncbi:MAG: AcrR family transcriptional regulator [Maribacter sp.]|jgi:AcrR family transcriptional regulator